jgi:hypothetical protein
MRIQSALRKSSTAIACVLGASQVREWESGRQPAHLDSLRAALRATRAIAMTSGKANARSWFVSTSSRLNLIAPLEVIRQDDAESRSRPVGAALDFATQ